MFALATVMSVGSAPDPSLSKVTESSNNLDPAISALAFISALTIDPSTMLSELTVKLLFNKPLAIFVFAIAALPLISASTIVPSKILSEVTEYLKFLLLLFSVLAIHVLHIELVLYWHLNQQL